MSDFVAPNSKRAFEEAKVLGLEVVIPDNHTLQVDIDSREDMNVFLEHFAILQKYYPSSTYTDKPSRSGVAYRKHITVTMPYEFTVWQRLALQACLGSDRKREILSFVQADEDDPHPILFLEKKEAQAVAQ